VNLWLLTMSYTVGSVFNLDLQFDLASPAVGTETGKTMDISSYIDPTPSTGSGVGLAIYKVHFDWSDTTGNSVVPQTEEGGGRAALIVGDIGYSGTTSIVAQNDFVLSNSNQNLVASQDFFGPLYMGGTASPGAVHEMEIQMPTIDVPFVAVRNALNLVWGQGSGHEGTTTTNISVRIECAKLKLSPKILNQLLRTQTA